MAYHVGAQEGVRVNNNTVLKWTGQAEQQNSKQEVAIKHFSTLLVYFQKKKNRSEKKIMHIESNALIAITVAI